MYTKESIEAILLREDIMNLHNKYGHLYYLKEKYYEHSPYTKEELDERMNDINKQIRRLQLEKNQLENIDKEINEKDFELKHRKR